MSKTSLILTPDEMIGVTIKGISIHAIVCNVTPHDWVHRPGYKIYYCKYFIHIAVRQHYITQLEQNNTNRGHRTLTALWRSVTASLRSSSREYISPTKDKSEVCQAEECAGWGGGGGGG